MSEKIWDEYDWERFLQEQDRKTEQYMELLEKYRDHPNRDQIISREMGWTHLDSASGLELEEDDLAYEQALDDENELSELEAQKPSDIWQKTHDKTPEEEHPLQQASYALNIAVHRMITKTPALQEDVTAIKLATHTAIASGKLAAALDDDDIDEMGLTIAYLKRSLKAVNTALEAFNELRKAGQIDTQNQYLLNQLIFTVRDGVISEMGSVRSAWRKRHGH